MRYYEQKFPEVDDYVIVQVKQIQDMGAYVSLLEYDNIEGMILQSELSRRRIRSIQKLVRVGRNEVVVVLRVDKEKGYIDLSKRRVSAEDIVKCEDRYAKAKTVHSIMRHVAEKTGRDLEELNESITWPLYRKYGHAYDAFKASITDPAVFEEFQMTEQTLEELNSNIARRLTPQPVKIRADFNLRNPGFTGVEGIRKAIRKGQRLGTEEIPINVKLTATPSYVMESTSTDKQGAISRLERALEVIKEEIESADGTIEVTMKPKPISEAEDKELEALMERMANDNKSGSEDSDEDDE